MGLPIDIRNRLLQAAAEFIQKPRPTSDLVRDLMVAACAEASGRKAWKRRKQVADGRVKKRQTSRGTDPTPVEIKLVPGAADMLKARGFKRGGPLAVRVYSFYALNHKRSFFKADVRKYLGVKTKSSVQNIVNKMHAQTILKKLTDGSYQLN